MSIELFTNNASSLLASGITNVATTLALTPGTGVLFPSPGAGQIAVVTLEDTLGVLEIMWCTGRSGDTLTVTRAQEGTAAAAFSSGSRVELRATAGVMTSMLQKNGGDTLAGTTNLSGVLALGGGGSIQGGEYAAGFLRSAAGATAGQIFVNGSGVPKSGTATILTDANLATNMPAGFGLIQTNMIVMWYGSSGSVPAGFHLCDGTGGTPDMRDKFVLGAGGALSPTFGGTGGSASSAVTGTITGTVDSHVITSAEMPSHRHRLRASGGGGITGSATLTNASAFGLLADSSGGHADGPFDDTTHPGGIPWVENTGGGGGHTHTLTGVPISAGSVSTVPPYVGLFFIMKT